MLDRESEFLESVYSNISLGQSRSAIRYVFRRFDQLLADNNFDVADDILARVQPQRLDVDSALSFMTITFAARHKLKRRADLYDLIHNRISELADRTKADDLLRKLR